MVALSCFSQKVTIDGVSYKIKNGEARVTKVDKSIDNLYIRSSITFEGKEYSVTSIDDVGYCPFLRFVSIPNSVNYIYPFAFSACTNLLEMVVPDEPLKGKKKEWYYLKNLINVRCQNGSFPTYILSYLPKDCAFMTRYKNGLITQQVTVPTIQSSQTEKESPMVEKSPTSDIDIDIPTTNIVSDKTFAVIFANENYQEEENVDFAKNDGKIFKEYCQKVLGLPEDNIHIRMDATLNNILAEMTWMQQVAEAYDGNARFFLFYAGHGIPEEKTGSAYLLPVDGKGNMLETGYSLTKLYEELGKMPTELVTVFIDACFCGSKRGDGMLASARGIAIKAKSPIPQGKMIVFSAAQGDETAYPLKDKEHGLFTYYLLKKIKETKGNISYGELADYITAEVKKRSIVKNGKMQTPRISSSGNIKDWRNLKLK